MGYQFKVAAWNDEYVKYLAEELLEKLEEKYEDWEFYVDDEGDINLYESDNMESSLEVLLEEDDLGGIVDDDFRELADLVFTVFHNFNPKYFDNVADTIKEAYNDTVEYNKDPLGYHGMSQKDFL